MDLEKKLWIKISLIKGIGNARIHALYENFKTSENILKAKPYDLKPILGERLSFELKNLIKERVLDDYIKKLKKHNVKVLMFYEKEYPYLLKNINDPPFVLYLKGENILSNYNIAVVGTRRPSVYGLNSTRFIVKELIESGFQIVSGFARGIDTQAHKVCVENSSRTIAVFGSGIDYIYPPENKKLYYSILDKGGAIISEVPLESLPEKHNFPKRNRIISGISYGVVVVEAPLKSGALITVSHALNQGREVFAIPGSIFEKNAKGVNKLIQDGAKLIMDRNDVIDEINIPEERKKKIKVKSLTQQEKEIIKYLNEEPKTIEEISFLSGEDIPLVVNLLLQLELKGKVKSLPGSKYVILR